MKEQKHSPLPWRIKKHCFPTPDDEECFSVVSGKDGEIHFSMPPYDSTGITIENAEFIIEACNNYERLKEENARLREENSILRKPMEHFTSIPVDVINSFPATTAQQMQANAMAALAKLRALQQKGGENEKPNH